MQPSLFQASGRFRGATLAVLPKNLHLVRPPLPKQQVLPNLFGELFVLSLDRPQKPPTERLMAELARKPSEPLCNPVPHTPRTSEKAVSHTAPKALECAAVKQVLVRHGHVDE